MSYVLSELELLRNENTKLRYRLGILTRATDEANKRGKPKMSEPNIFIDETQMICTFIR